MIVDDLDTICRYICRIYSSLDIFCTIRARWRHLYLYSC